MATENKNLSVYDRSSLPNAEQLKVGIVVSEWNGHITDGLYQEAVQVLKDCGMPDENIIKWNVPGSFELIFGAARMHKTLELDAVIVIGCVIQGETKHFDFVCEGVTQGIKDLNVKYDIPTIFCVLTDNNEQQSIDRSGGKHGNKGVEAGVTALKMIALNKGL